MRLAIFFILLANILRAQENFRCSNLSMNEGLTSNYVECVFTDSRGFAWIGTWNGLCRYDGHSVKPYMPLQPTSTVLNGNWIYTVVEDQNKQLWLGSNMGLFSYSRERDTFACKALPHESVTAIAPDKSGVLWLATMNGIHLFDPATRAVMKRESEMLRRSKILRSRIRDIVFDSKDRVWISTDRDGLMVINLKNDKQTIYSIDELTHGLTSNKLSSMVFDKRGRLWVGTQDQGLCVLDTARRTAVSYRHSLQDKASIGSNSVYQISCDKEGTVWVSCANGFLNRYIEKTHSFMRYEFNKAFPDNLSPKSVKGLFTDSHGNRWISTHGEGVYLYNKAKNKIRSISPRTESRTNFTYISCFEQLAHNKFLVGSDGDGLWEYDPEKGLTPYYDETNRLMSNSILAIASDKRRNRVWISTWRGGLVEMDEKLRIQHIYKNTNSAGDIVSDNSKALLLDDSVLWVSTHGGGLCYFDYRTKRFAQTPIMKLPVRGNNVFRDSKRRLWVACLNSLYLYADDTVKRFENNDSVQYMSSSNVLRVFEDSKKRLWAVTSKGVDRYDDSSGRFRQYIGYPQLHCDIKSLVEDNRGLFWLGSDYGVFCVDIDRAAVLKHIYQANGLLHNNCFQNAAYKASDGTLFFGVQGGFSAFHPDSLGREAENPQIVITDLFINNVLQHPRARGFYPSHIQTADSLTLSSSKDNITLLFTGILASNPQAMQYWYRLEGFNDSWISLGASRSIVLANIPPGTYRLQIKGKTDNGSLGYNNDGLTLIITPRWWETLLFRIVLAGIAVLSIFLYIRIRMYRVRKENQRLEKMVALRTAELREMNSQIKEHAEELRVSNERLYQNQKITQAKNKELNDTIHTKDTIISIVAHDLKNPMGALYGIAELLYRNVETGYPEKIKKYSASILSSSKTIMDQMVSLLDWARSQMHDIKYQPEEAAIHPLISDTIMLLHEIAKKKGIGLLMDVQATHTAFIDPRMIATVIRNLVGNSIKFTPKAGTISISTLERAGEILITISDTGVGIPPEKIDTLFDDAAASTTYGTENEKGTGLGLKICMEFVMQNKGTLSVESVVGKGTSFLITLPTGKEIRNPQG